MQALDKVSYLTTLTITDDTPDEVGFIRVKSKEELANLKVLEGVNFNVNQEKMRVDFSKRHIIALVNSLPDDSYCNNYKRTEILDDKIRVVVNRVIEKKEGIVKKNRTEIIFLSIDSSLPNKISVQTLLPD